MLNQKLLEILRCPVCHSEKPLTQEGKYLICSSCNNGFVVEDEIPHLLREEAVPAEQLKQHSREAENKV